jgi:hypothetical protein
VTDYDENLKRLELFVRTYEGPKLAIVATGGAAHLGDLAAIPGASRVLHSVDVPYATELVPLKDYSAVSEERLYELKEFYSFCYGGPKGIRWIIVTAALTTDRYRRGPNHAWVQITGRNHYFAMDKLSEAEHFELAQIPGGILQRRQQEDWDLTHRVLDLLQVKA